MNDTEYGIVPQLMGTLIDHIRLARRDHRRGDLGGEKQSAASARGPSISSLTELDAQVEIIEAATNAVNRWTAQTIASLHRRRNQLTSLCRHLPNEILSSIFELVEELPYPKFGGHGMPTPPIPLLHVSSAWRETALATPRLWIHINVASMPTAMVESLLRWSKHASLDIKCDIYPSDPPRGFRNLALIAPHSDRWGSLRAHGIKEVLALLQSHAPRLEALRVATVGQDEQITLGTIFPGAISLRKLTLDGVHIPFNSPVYSRLKELILVRISTQSTVGDLIQAMEASPELHALHLDNVEFLPEQSHHTLTKPIKLPYLCELTVLSRYLDTRSIYRILSSIRDTPPSLMINMWIELEIVSPLSQGFGDIFPQSEGVEYSIQSLVRAESLRISAFTPCILINGFLSGAPLFKLEISGHNMIRGPFLPSLGRVFPMPHLRSLTFTASLEKVAGVETAFLTICENLPYIEELEVDECHWSVLEILVNHQVLPCLKKLSLGTIARLSEASLIRLVESRARPRIARPDGDLGVTPLGGGVGSLQFLGLLYCPSITEATVAELRGLVDEVVVWDEEDD
ncbi:hypothetical protein BOTBODRAFT_486156 [Botryobasidium botryosum FD-172 SS1]|uniref:Uncharacterized protein n=1 Tax=Botryobasidium botryosum (strain FD-172 SS1) TaxID=930990 RepID=A0A067N4X0_BOTB1|nr:hypothetical protein BOTBODRAFT_486156 [Botryobasidium botryosum FD-172 SS1]